MTDLKLLHPRKDSLPPLRFGEELGIVVDVHLDVPWVELPNLGRRLHSLDGEPEVAHAIETKYPVPVKALAGGRAELKDTGRDDHAPSGAPRGNAGRGVEVIVKTGAGFELTYSHLKRGSGRMGLLKTGDVVGQSGNSGRCIDGAKSAFVKLAARNGGSQIKLEELLEPVTVDATWNGVPVVAPKRLEAGAVDFKAFPLTRVLIEAGKDDIFRAGENEIHVCVRRGPRVLAQVKETVILEW